MPVVAAAGGHSLLVGGETNDCFVEYKGLSCNEIKRLVQQQPQRVLCQLPGKLQIIESQVLPSSVGSG